MIAPAEVPSQNVGGAQQSGLKPLPKKLAGFMKLLTRAKFCNSQGYMSLKILNL